MIDSLATNKVTLQKTQNKNKNSQSAGLENVNSQKSFLRLVLNFTKKLLSCLSIHVCAVSTAVQDFILCGSDKRAHPE